MKKKGFLIGGAALILAGAMCFAAVLMKHGWDPQRLSNRDYHLRDGGRWKDVVHVVVEDRNTGVVIQRGKGSDVIITYWESDDSWYDIEQRDGSLFITKRIQSGFQLFNFDFVQRDLLISLPVDFDGAISVETKNGRIVAEDIVASNAMLSTENADITLLGAKLKELRCDTENGDFRLKNVSASKLLFVYGENGDISVENIAAPKISIYDSNGDVTGTVAGRAGDYNVAFFTKNGDGSYQKNTGSAKEILISNKNGDIDVTFTE